MKNKKLKLSGIINSGIDTREDLNCSESILKATLLLESIIDRELNSRTIG